MGERLLDFAMQLVLAEERARQAVKPVPVEAKPLSTYVVDRRDVTLRGEEVVASCSGRGVLQEFVAKAEDTDFQVWVEKDGEKIIRGTYGEYAEISQDVEGIDAFAERDEDGNLTGAYVFKAGDIDFTRSLTVVLKMAKPVKFRVVFCRYKVAEA